MIRKLVQLASGHLAKPQVQAGIAMALVTYGTAALLRLAKNHHLHLAELLADIERYTVLMERGPFNTVKDDVKDFGEFPFPPAEDPKTTVTVDPVPDQPV